MSHQLKILPILAHSPDKRLEQFKQEPESQPKSMTMADFWIKQGWYKKMKDGSKKLKTGKWRDNPEVRSEAVRFLVEKVLKKDPRDINGEDFHSNRLGGLLHTYYKDSPYDALKEAGYDFHPWEMLHTPMSFYQSKENRVAAIRWLVDKLKKDPRDISVEDFHSNRLDGLLTYYYAASPYGALQEAGYDFHPWEMIRTPARLFESKENRIAAVRWLVQKLGKDPRDISVEDFYSNRLCGLFTGYYGDSLYDALREAGYDFHPWEMIRTPARLFDSKENRVAAIRWLVGKLGKEPRNITGQDFCSNRLDGLIDCYDDSPYEALLDAGLVTQADEIFMRSHRHTQDNPG